VLQKGFGMNQSDRLLALSLLFLVVSTLVYFMSMPREASSLEASETAKVEPLSAVQQTPTTPAENRVQQSLDYESHVKALRKTVDPAFTIVVEKPFVVIGDQTPAEVERWASGTIRWAVSQIKEQYFEKDPDHIIDIWLFKNKASYEANAKARFGSVPATPYGYYSPTDKALVMNISTGGGTLVHEIVHPFMAANFEACPSWFNEGLASLYEESSERDGKIVGLTNWRLRGLQLAIKDDLLGSFEKMMSTGDREFYEGDSSNYAQARYLCYWLQEKKLLHKYFHQFMTVAKEDPEGIKTLKSVLETNDLDAFQKEWEREVLKLRFR